MSDTSNKNDEITDNIAWSSELIAKLEKTTRSSQSILDQTIAFHESRKLVESSRQMSVLALHQLRRSR